MNKFENTTELIVRTLIKEDDKILLCKNKERGHYFLPGGHVEFGDTLQDTIYKEMEEEIGLTKSDIKNVSFVNYLESSYTENKVPHCELNMIFNLELSDKKRVRSKEGHIDFEWVSLSDIETINLLPTDIKKFLD